jgi:hypothetical protein
MGVDHLEFRVLSFEFSVLSGWAGLDARQVITILSFTKQVKVGWALSTIRLLNPLK